MVGRPDHLPSSIYRFLKPSRDRDLFSGAPACAKRAWDRAPYPWNMVNLFSFGCHVIDRAYVRTYVNRLYGWGRGDYQKEGRGVSCVSWQVHIFNRRTLTIWSIDSCPNRIATDQYPMTISRAHVSTHRGDVIYLEAVCWPVNCFTRSRTTFNLILLLVWEHRKTDNAHILHTYYTHL